jgi:membrane fusion protein (multidrug efflux system)
MIGRPLAAWLVAAAMPLLSIACDKAPGAAGGASAGPVEVGVITLSPRDVTLTTELPGRTSPFRVAEVRARATGIVQKRHFTEGADVVEGQKLFTLDSAPYQADAARARAALSRAEATAANSKVQAERAEMLTREGVGSKAQTDDAAAAARTAEADVAASRAALQAAGISLGFTNVVAPISGRIGRAEVTEGGFAQAATATLLATIQQLDPLYVDLTWASADALRLRRDLESGKIKAEGGKALVTIVLEDGSAHPQKGELQFTDASVDPTTGSVSLRVLVPNPKRDLLPGMFVRARLEEGTRAQAIVVPQRGVTRDANGKATALVVGQDNKVERRAVDTEREVDNGWLVLGGLAGGDRVIVEGLQKVRPGAEVKVVPAKEAPPPASAAAAAAAAAAGATGSAQVGVVPPPGASAAPAASAKPAADQPVR